MALLTVGCVAVQPLLRRLAPDPASLRTPTPQLLGRSRAFPYPKGDVATSQDWEVAVLAVLRGERAWERLRAANMFNDPPPEGLEYLLIKLAVTSTAWDRVESPLRLFVTGDQGVVYDGFSATPPAPRLDYEFGMRETKEGWRAFLIRDGEQNLLLGFNTVYGTDDPITYLALEEGARCVVDLALEDIEPTGLGTNPSSPASLGATVTTKDWQVSVEQVLWDEAAWEVLLEANQFNEPPPENRRYLLVQIRVRYIGTVEGPELIGGYDFGVLGGDDKIYDPPAVVEPEPELSASLYPDGTFTGWLAMETDHFTEDPVLVFDPSYQETEIRYLALTYR